MISTDEIRQEVMAAFKIVHEANSTLLVNYPNHTVVDIERQADPFISLELDFSQHTRSALGEREILAPSFLRIYFYYREGTGMSSAYKYTDMINQYLSMSQVGALQFGENQVLNIQTFPGWLGVMNTLRFDIVPALSC